MSPTEIRGIRRGLGLSQSQLAAYLGIANARTVQRWESGDVLITGPAARCLEYMALHGLTRLSTVTEDLPTMDLTKLREPVARAMCAAAAMKPNTCKATG